MERESRPGSLLFDGDEFHRIHPPKNIRFPRCLTVDEVLFPDKRTPRLGRFPEMEAHFRPRSPPSASPQVPDMRRGAANNRVKRFRSCGGEEALGPREIQIGEFPW